MISKRRKFRRVLLWVNVLEDCGRVRRRLLLRRLYGGRKGKSADRKLRSRGPVLPNWPVARLLLEIRGYLHFALPTIPREPGETAEAELSDLGISGEADPGVPSTDELRV